MSQHRNRPATYIVTHHWVSCHSSAAEWKLFTQSTHSHTKIHYNKYTITNRPKADKAGKECPSAHSFPYPSFHKHLPCGCNANHSYWDKPHSRMVLRSSALRTPASKTELERHNNNNDNSTATPPKHNNTTQKSNPRNSSSWHRRVSTQKKQEQDLNWCQLHVPWPLMPQDSQAPAL